MGYYRYIKGKKYDHQLLEQASTMIGGKGDGRISLSDVKQLIEAALDGGTITEVEKDTLQYIYDNYRWTDKAKSYFDSAFPKKKISVESIIDNVIQEKIGLSKLKVHIDPIEVKRQASQYKNSISFEDALTTALNSFLVDGKESNSLRNILMNVHGLHSKGNDQTENLLNDLVKTHLNDAEIMLIPAYQHFDEDAELDFERPEGGEKIKKNWIFGLRVFDLRGHYFWAVIDRKNTLNHYNYGIN